MGRPVPEMHLFNRWLGFVIAFVVVAFILMCLWLGFVWKPY